MTEGVKQRDERGRFAVGNTAAIGRSTPRASNVWALRETFDRSVTPEDIEEVVQALIDQAKAGDIRAVGTLLDRCLGKADSTAERIDRLIRDAIKQTGSALNRALENYIPEGERERFIDDLFKELDKEQANGLG